MAISRRAGAWAGKAGAELVPHRAHQHARNLGASLASERIDRHVGINLDVVLTDPSPPCVQPVGAGPGMAVRVPVPATPPPGDAFGQAYEAGWFEHVGYKIEPSPMAREWARG